METHILVSSEMVQKPQLSKTSFSQDLHVSRRTFERLLSSGVKIEKAHAFFVNTFVTFLTAQVSPVWLLRAADTHLIISFCPPYRVCGRLHTRMHLDLAL